MKCLKELKLGPEGESHMVWTTLWMGFAPSSANSIKHLGLAQEIARGDPLDVDDPFRWSQVVLKIPGSEDFNPSLPWVSSMKKRTPKLLSVAREMQKVWEKEGRGRKQYFAQTFVGNGKITLPVRTYGAKVATL